LSTEVNDEDAIKLAFKLFDENGDEKVEEQELFGYALPLAVFY